jgi:DNA polymerase-1
MYQCATERISVTFLKQGSSGFEDVDPAEVVNRYGIGPELVPDFIALRGDPSDGLPGAPGIGAKTAAALLQKYGSLEQAIAHADDERPRVAAALRDNADELRAYRAIATLRPVELERPPDRSTDLKSGAAAVRELEMFRLAERLEKAEKLTDL